MGTDSDILATIANGKPVRIFLPLTNKIDRLRAQCVVQDILPPHFSLVFQVGMLPVAALDLTQTAIINIDVAGISHSIEAKILKIASPQTLYMIVQKWISHEQLRDFFRIDAATKIIVRSLPDQPLENQHEMPAIEGKTIDLSGSGLLALFGSSPPQDKQVHLEITIPSGEQEVVQAVAHQIRHRQRHDGNYEVAYHFDDISIEDRDKIIGCCLVIQRKLLRLKVQVEER